MKKAIITGVTGQDGSYLAELLLDKGFHVTGIIRRSSSFNTERVDHLYDNKNFQLVYGDLSDSSSMWQIVADTKPDHFYNLASQSHVRVSFDVPEYTCDIGAMGTLRCLEAIRKFSPDTRFYQASSSEMYGSEFPPQDETTPFHPRSPYSCGKAFAYNITTNYRESYNMFASNGILFNHESPRRGETFLTRKVTRAVGRIYYDLQKELCLGNLESKRDWGHAKDYVKAMYMILEHDKPDDFCISTGEAHSVREFIEKAFYMAGLDPWKYIKFDSKYIRPAEVDHLQGNSLKAKKILGWEPEISFDELVKEMVEHDLELAKKEYHMKMTYDENK